MNFPTVLFGPDGEQYSTYAAHTPTPATGRPSPRWGLGTQLITPDGRRYRFAESGGSTLVIGNVLQAKAPISTDVNLTPDNAAAIGDRLITFTHGAATVVVNMFAEGYAVISVTPGGGDVYKILSHLALTNNTAGDVVNLDVRNQIRVALTTTSRVDLVNHPYSKVIQSPASTLSSAPVGVAVSAPLTVQFCWVQTAGVASVLTEGTVVIGNRAVVATSTAGACGPESDTAGTMDNQVTIGRVIGVAATAAWSSVMLALDVVE